MDFENNLIQLLGEIITLRDYYRKINNVETQHIHSARRMHDYKLLATDEKDHATY